MKPVPDPEGRLRERSWKGARISVGKQREVLFVDVIGQRYDDDTALNGTLLVNLGANTLVSHPLGIQDNPGYEQFEVRLSLSDLPRGELPLEIGIAGGDSIVRYRSVRIESAESLPRQGVNSGPNVLLLIADTLRADHCSFLGYPRETTPFLDRWSAEGRVYEAAMSPAAWTLPSVTSILTGMVPSRHGSRHGGELVPPGIELLAERFRARGITTFAVSTNPLIDAYSGLHEGFETFSSHPWDPAANVRFHFTQWLEQNRTNRWFAYLHFTDPHDPYQAPERYFSKASYHGPFEDPAALNQLYFSLNFGETPPFTAGEEDYQELKNRYDDEIRYLDSQLEELVTLLDSEGLLENTVVAFTSDHGEAFGEHDRVKHGHTLFEEEVHVPLILRGPGITPGRVSAPIGVRLLGATLLQLAGLPANSPILEHSRTPPLLYTSYPTTPANTRRRERLGLRIGDLKLISEMGNGRPTRLDLARDPDEQHPSKPSRAQRERLTQLEAWFAAQEPADDLGTSGDLADERLRALGYVK
jgi:arylsulfatase A-like enzyme